MSDPASESGLVRVSGLSGVYRTSGVYVRFLRFDFDDFGAGLRFLGVGCLEGGEEGSGAGDDEARDGAVPPRPAASSSSPMRAASPASLILGGGGGGGAQAWLAVDVVLN